MRPEKEKLEGRIRLLVEEENLELVEMEFFEAGPASILRLYVDKAGGVTVDQCAYLSRKIGDFLDTENLIPGRYTLQVSSPGLDRPLISGADFKRKIGEKVRIFLKEQADGRKELVGEIKDFEKENIHLLMEKSASEMEEGGEEIIPLAKVAKAMILF
jgi:ribosome maturation factor RimP